MIVGYCLSVALRLSKMQDQKLLSLRWRSFLGGGNDIVNSIFAHKGGRYIDYGLMSMHSTLSVHDVGPKIVDTHF